MSHHAPRFTSTLATCAAALTVTACLPSNAQAASTSPTHSQPPSSRTSSVLPVRPTSTSTGNWAGYQVRTFSPQSISATWRVPRVTWAGRDTVSTAWVGLGGGTRRLGSLLQAGTGHDNTCVKAINRLCTRSVSRYYAFVEVYPQRPLERITNLTVRPGDVISASVTYSPKTSRATMVLTNHTRARAVTYSRVAPAPKAVAQAVVERTANLAGNPGALAKMAPLTFHAVRVHDARGTHKPVQLSNTRITMMGTKGALASTSRLSYGGDAFTVRYHRSA